MTTLTVYTVLGEGEKLLLEIPEHMRDVLSIQPGMKIELEDIALWDDIARACNDHDQVETFSDSAARKKQCYRLIFGDTANDSDKKQ